MAQIVNFEIDYPINSMVKILNLKSNFYPLSIDYSMNSIQITSASNLQLHNSWAWEGATEQVSSSGMLERKGSD